MRFRCLRLLGPGDQEKLYQADQDGITIGRASDTDITLLDRHVSRHHAKLVKGKKDYSIVDLKSTKGTFVNGQKIEKQTLKHADKIRLGHLELIFLTRDPDGSDPAYAQITGESLEKSLSKASSVFTDPEYAQYSELKKMSCILDFQYQWGQQFSSEEIFEQILKSALEISGAERGFVLVKETEGFDYAAGRGEGDSVLSPEDFRASQSIVDQVAHTGEPVFSTEHISGELALQDSILEMHLQAFACLPLKGISSESEGPQVLGILYLDSTGRMHRLSTLDQKILKKLAVEAGNVLEKVELVRSVEERKTFERELALAHETQRNLLPHSLPQFGDFQIRAFSEPTRYVGGDFYDFLEPRSGELLGVLADVSGKGIPAALLSSLLQGALDMECRTTASLGKVLDRVNKFLYQRSHSNNFATLFLFSLTPEGKGEYVSAGHNPVYLFRADSGDIDELTSDGLILGAFDFASYNSQPLQLNPGDVLVVYSDGVTEADNPEGEMFGEERLRNIIQSEAAAGVEVLKKQILDAIERFTEGTSQTDDITFLLVQSDSN